MNEQEMKELFQQLEEQGWNPQVCDTPVPYFTNGVPAGYPDAPGDYDGEYERIPKALMRICDFIVSVRGDSMKDADIESGDDVIVKKCGHYDDGDIVVVYFDGETTLKSICHYEDETWLVPANDNYKPFCISDCSSVYILGKVTSVRKKPLKMSYASIQKRLKDVKKCPRREITDRMVTDALTQVLHDIKCARMWFCIYSVLTEAETGLLSKGDYEGLKKLVDRLFPDNDLDVNPRYVSVMDVSSFRKSFREWNEKDAPVQGKRFRQYCNLASDFYGLLMK